MKTPTPNGSKDKNKGGIDYLKYDNCNPDNTSAQVIHLLTMKETLNAAI